MDVFIADGMSPDKLLLPPVDHRESKDNMRMKSTGLFILENSSTQNIVPKDKVSRLKRIPPKCFGIVPLKSFSPIQHKYDEIRRQDLVIAIKVD